MCCTAGIAVNGMPNQCRWTLKPEFGEVPQYLVKNKQQIAEEKAKVEEHLRLRQQQVIPPHVRQGCAIPGTSITMLIHDIV